MENPYEDGDKVNECLWCGKPCEKDFCNDRCAFLWVTES